MLELDSPRYSYRSERRRRANDGDGDSDARPRSHRPSYYYSERAAAPMAAPGYARHADGGGGTDRPPPPGTSTSRPWQPGAIPTGTYPRAAASLSPRRWQLCVCVHTYACFELQRAVCQPEGTGGLRADKGGGKKKKEEKGRPRPTRQSKRRDSRHPASATTGRHRNELPALVAASPRPCQARPGTST